MVTITTPEDEFLPEKVEFICPFCGKKAVADTVQYTVGHAMPTCERFDKLEPDEFLAQVNKERLARMPKA